MMPLPPGPFLQGEAADHAGEIVAPVQSAGDHEVLGARAADRVQQALHAGRRLAGGFDLVLGRVLVLLLILGVLQVAAVAP